MKKSLPFLALIFLLGLLRADAATFTVNNTADTGVGSLRQALVAAAAAVGADTIVFNASNFTPAAHTITLGSEIVVGDADGVTIDASALASGVTITGNVRFFTVSAGARLTLRALTLTGGTGNGSNVALANRGGAIHNSGTLIAERCTFFGNTSGANNSGGAIWTAGTATLTQCTFSSNTSGNWGGAIVSEGTTALTHCTIAGNTATNFGGGIRIHSGLTTVTNSIISGNTAATGADVYANGPLGGILRVGANIIPGFAKTPDAPDSGPAAFTFDPLLGPLADHGGPTETRALLAYSQAIDAVPAAAIVAGLDIDQRGFARRLGSAPDLGALESGHTDFTADGLSLYARVPAVDIGTGVFFEVSVNADFSVATPTVSTFAGIAGTFGSTNALRDQATFNYPSGVAQDSLGNYFVADTINNRIRMIDPDGDVSTIAGNGTYGLGNGPGLNAALQFPSAIAVGPDDNVYFSDTYNHRICKLTRPATSGAQWVVSTLAGTGIAGFRDGAGTVALFNFPYGLDVDAQGYVYVADALNNRIRKISPTGATSTFAGTGVAGTSPDNTAAASARFRSPQGLVIVSKPTFADTICIADRDNHTIRQISLTPDAAGYLAGTVSTLAGSGTAGGANGTGTAASFREPSALAADSDRNLYVTDETNHVIRRITPAGVVTTIAGSGTAGFLDGVAATARFNTPTGIVVSRDGTLVVADSKNFLLRSVAVAPLRVPAIADLGNVDAVGVQLSAVLDFALLGLNPDTRYYFRYRLPNDTTQTLGQSFVQVRLPEVTTVAAANQTPTSAQLKGTVDPNNLPTRAVLEYSTEPTLIAPYAVTTVAGTGTAGFLDAPLPAQAQFSSPAGLVVSGANTYVADVLNHRIRRISPAGVVTTFAGSGLAGRIDAAGTAARFDRPAAVVAEPDVVLTAGSTVFGSTTVTCASTAQLAIGAAVVGTNIAAGATVSAITNATDFVISLAATGTSSGLTLTAGGAAFYVADQFNHVIRKISANGLVTTLAGSGIAGFQDGVAGGARFLFPSSLALDSAQPPNVYVADSGNHSIRKIAPDGTVSTVAGTGVAGAAEGPGAGAQFSTPRGIAITPTGDLLVADTGNHTIRRITEGVVSTFAGTTQGYLDGPGASAQFNAPQSLAVAADGTVSVADSGNHRIRAITPGAEVSTFAGSGIAGAVNSPVSGLYPVSAAQFNLPAGLALDGAGGVLVTQEGLVRRIARSALPTLPTAGTLTGTNAQPISGDASGLLPGTTYYFRAKGTCLQATVTGAILSLTTPPTPITVAAGPTIAAPAITAGQTAVIDFGETPLGTPTARQFTIANPNGGPITVSSINVPAGYQLTAGSGVTAIPAGGTLVFEVTLLANSTGGTRSGNVVINSDAAGLTVFTFPITGVVLAPPSVTTTAVTGNGATVATLNGTVNPQGAPTNVWFQWSVTGQFDGVLVSAIAGSSTGFAEGLGAAAQFNQPHSIVADATGNLFVADTMNHRIRRVATDGTVSTFAGTGTAGFADGAGTAAQFNEPTGLAIDGSGTLYVADSLNHRIRAITTGGVVSTYAGFLGVAGFTDGVAAGARFSTPTALALDAAGVLYIADRNNHRIRAVALDGAVTTLAGTGTAGSTNGAGTVAQFSQPRGLAIDAAGFLYVTEATSHAIRKIAPDGTTSLYAGAVATPGATNGVAASARFSSPAGIAIDDGGSLFVADQGNHLIRRLTPTTGLGGALSVSVTTFAGTGTAGGTNGLKNVAQFNNPVAVLATADRGAIVGELTASTVRKVTPTEPLLAAATGLTGTVVTPVSLQVTGLTIGNTYSYRTVGTNARGTNFGAAVSFVAGTPFELWQLARFGANASDPLIGALDATPANDGITNRVKYALGLDPLLDSVESLPVAVVNNGIISITYHRVLSATDVVYTVQWSSDLQTWQTAGITEVASPPNAGRQQYVASIPIAPQRVKFLRINITFLAP